MRTRWLLLVVVAACGTTEETTHLVGACDGAVTSVPGEPGMRRRRSDERRADHAVTAGRTYDAVRARSRRSDGGIDARVASTLV